MQKPFALATSAALLFTGCQTKSPTWQKVMAAPRTVGDAEARDRAYAAGLHQHLGATPHKVVTYEFEYSSKYQGRETGQRTAVIYFDNSTRKQPWWLMDDSLAKPVWLPNEPLPRQVTFFARRPARIVEVHDYTVSRDKIVQSVERPARRPVGTSTLQRVERAERVEPVKARPVIRDEEPRAPKPRWRLFRKPAAKKEAPVTRLEPAVAVRPTKVKTERAVVKSERKAPAPKPAVAPAKAKASDQPKPAPDKPKERLITAPEQSATSQPAPPRKEDPKRPAETEPKKRPPLFNREKTEPAPALPPPPSDAAAERPRKNLLQRILGSLNPARWFRRTA